MKSSRRSLLAGLWSLVALLTTAGFVLAIGFAIASQKYDPNYGNGNYYNYNNNNNNNNDPEEEEDRDNYRRKNNGAMTVTSRAMVFSALWTAVLSGILVIYGFVLLGVTIPFTGKYYSCCPSNVHRMTPITLGSFGGSLLMFANLTLVCAILFGEFQIIPSFGDRREPNQDDENYNNTNVIDDSSYAFSVLCIFFTVMYAGFALLIFYFSTALLEESVVDALGGSSSDESTSSGMMDHHLHHHHQSLKSRDQGIGYIGGDRFDVVGRSPYGKAVTTQHHRNEMF